MSNTSTPTFAPPSLTPSYPQLSSDSDSHNVKITTITKTEEEELDEILEKEGIEVNENDESTDENKSNDSLMDFKRDLIKLMNKQLETINLIVNLK